RGRARAGLNAAAASARVPSGTLRGPRGRARGRRGSRGRPSNSPCVPSADDHAALLRSTAKPGGTMSSEPFSAVPGSAMVVVAHPDDAEFMVAGTVAKWAAGGCDVTYVVITKGDKGSEDPEMTPSRLTAIREAEQRAAGEVLGVRRCVFMGYDD